MSGFLDTPCDRPFSGVPPSIVTQMKYRNVMKAARSFSLVAAQDPLVRYIRNNRELSRCEKTYERLQFSVYLILCIHSKIALTICRGTANITATPPHHNQDPKDLATKFIKYIAQRLRRHRERTSKHPEEIKRRKEFDQKMSETVSSLFGEYVNEMWFVEHLGVEPSSQRQGYGGALLDSVTFLADLADKTTWLQSSNIANTEFYNKHGFFTVGTVVVGEHSDSTSMWDGQPVVVSIMIREPKKREGLEPKWG